MSPVELGPRHQRLPLGIRRILKETLSTIWSNFRSIAMLGFAPILALTIFRYLMAPGDFEPSSDGALGNDADAFDTGSILAFIIMFPVYAIVGGLIVRLVYAIKTGGDYRLRTCVLSVFAVLVPLVLCDSTASLGIIVGLIALIVPGLFLIGLWCALIPSIVIENAGFQCFERSAFLTKDYRFACIGTMVCFLAFDLGTSFFLDAEIGHLIVSDDLVDKAIYLVVEAFMDFVSSALFATATALIYLRLRDIKEGTAWLAGVFD